jgi:hypothetical protein
MIHNLSDNLTVLPFFPVNTKTAAATTNGTGVDMTQYIGKVMFILDSTAGTGTLPTLDIKFQEASDDSNYTDISGAAFTQVTSSGASRQSLGIIKHHVKRYIRAVCIVGGSATPTFTFNVLAVTEKENV